MVNYAFQKFDDHCAKASGQSLAISLKSAINICNKVKGMDAHKAVAYLEEVTKQKVAVPFTRFTDGVGHRKGPMASGRYPVKAAAAIGGLIKSAIANAEAKNFDETLTIVHINANKAQRPMHQGRKRRSEMKRAHVEVVLKETSSIENKAVAKKATKSKAPVKKAQTETKSVGKKEVAKPVAQPKAQSPVSEAAPAKSAEVKAEEKTTEAQA